MAMYRWVVTSQREENNLGVVVDRDHTSVEDLGLFFPLRWASVEEPTGASEGTGASASARNVAFIAPCKQRNDKW